ncbi:hypothetical protein BC936DRAFT_142191 [Jimgerdemannia flammicorona]|uniref:Uncharacterized protein n=2 Tax=Jimgerdemannia flammicorona TaxID=994334 RepID=A0A433QCV4_9FUNG|nr:hypothetical protein BC936DRAFT_142191 [Jimgerdemannia flammicorona]RUS27638.1 hypothetical protein BC938DRAFT_482960 [Jimgerdemannia flammicorona]
MYSAKSDVQPSSPGSKQASKAASTTATNDDTTENTHFPRSKRGVKFSKTFNWVNAAPQNFDTSTASQPKKRRRRTNPQELAILEAAFKENHLPDGKAREWLADKLKMPARAVQIWFQNRRQTTRKKTQVVHNDMSNDNHSSSSLGSDSDNGDNRVSDGNSNDTFTCETIATCDKIYDGRSDIEETANDTDCADSFGALIAAAVENTTASKVIAMEVVGHDIEQLKHSNPAHYVQNEDSNVDDREDTEVMINNLTTPEKVSASALVSLQCDRSIDVPPFSTSSHSSAASITSSKSGFPSKLASVARRSPSSYKDRDIIHSPPVTTKTTHSNNKSSVSPSLKRGVSYSTASQQPQRPRHKSFSCQSTISAPPTPISVVDAPKSLKHFKGFDTDEDDDSDKENLDPNDRSLPGTRQPKRRRLIRSYSTPVTPLSVSINHRSTSNNPTPPGLNQTPSSFNLTDVTRLGNYPLSLGRYPDTIGTPVSSLVVSKSVSTPASPAPIKLSTPLRRKPSLHLTAEATLRERTKLMKDRKTKTSASLKDSSTKTKLGLPQRTSFPSFCFKSPPSKVVLTTSQDGGAVLEKDGQVVKVGAAMEDINMSFRELEELGLLSTPPPNQSQASANAVKDDDVGDVHLDADANFETEADLTSISPNTFAAAKALTTRAHQDPSTFRDRQLSRSQNDVVGLLKEVSREGHPSQYGSDPQSSSSEFESLAVLSEAAVRMAEYLPVAETI